jgi:predicted AAA+ superfamily ATPase
MTREQLIQKFQTLTEECTALLERVRQTEDVETKLALTWQADEQRRQINLVQADLMKLDQDEVDRLHQQQAQGRY